MEETIFQKIIRKEVPADVVYEDEDVMAFYDIHPLAPVHVLIIPKKRIESIATMEKEDIALVGKMLYVARTIASDLHIADKGYKLLTRIGRDGGQEIPHLHLHLLGGAKLVERIYPE
ncbi:MAG: histidine triad nucleotide-binding protein [Candidatus Moranbacteria bacterium]|nr:histidine triad nucleotide-binding protein [Candidatus Moranbacteria bacterium]